MSIVTEAGVKIYVAYIFGRPRCRAGTACMNHLSGSGLGGVVDVA